MTIAKAIKLLVGLELMMFAAAIYGDDGIKRIRVNDAELLCRIDKDLVDTISFYSTGNNSAVTGRDFLCRIDRVFTAIRDRKLRLSQELRLYLGCNLPLEMRQTLYLVISEHYARRLALKDFSIPSSGREYAGKLLGRGYFHELDLRLSVYGYAVKSVFLEKVMIDKEKEVAVAFTDITLKRQNENGTTLEKNLVDSTKLKPRIQSKCLKTRLIQSKPHTRLCYDMGGGTNVWFFSFMRCRMKNDEDYTYYRYREISKNGKVYYEGGGGTGNLW